MEPETVKKIVEAALLASDRPLSVEELMGLFVNSSGEIPDEGDNAPAPPAGAGGDGDRPDRRMIRAALSALGQDCTPRCVELREVASGFRYQIRREYAPYIQRLWAERPVRYSRALLETLAIIAYRQPVTRAEIEEIRGVSVATSLLKTLREREWIRTLGHRDVPGRPALYGTTREFLDYFDLKSLEDMPPLAEPPGPDPAADGKEPGPATEEKEETGEPGGEPDAKEADHGTEGEPA